ncbi:MAG: hypothetical protein JSS81_06645 [Acidobacteria bacterium]|nr:hypothetical protein [Acidobacteriota bacterium]
MKRSFALSRSWQPGRLRSSPLSRSGGRDGQRSGPLSRRRRAAIEIQKTMNRPNGAPLAEDYPEG